MSSEDARSLAENRDSGCSAATEAPTPHPRRLAGSFSLHCLDTPTSRLVFSRRGTKARRHQALPHSQGLGSHVHFDLDVEVARAAGFGSCGA